MRRLLLSLLATTSAFSIYSTPLKDVDLTGSLLSGGRWVRIRVDSTGIHQMLHSDLAALGFSDPQSVKVYGYSAAVLGKHELSGAPVDLPEIASLHSAGKLLFYAEPEISPQFEARSTFGRQRNPYAGFGCYFLSDRTPTADAQATMTAAPQPPAAATDSIRRCHRRYQLFENDIELPSDGGTYFTDRAIGSEISPEPTVISVSGIASPELRVRIVAAIGNHESASGNYLTALFPNNDAEISSLTTRSANKAITAFECFHEGIATISATLHPDHSDNILIQAIPPDKASASGFEYAAVDYITADYLRRNDLSEAAALDMVIENAGSGTRIKLEGASADTQVWNIDDPKHVICYPVTDDGYFTLTDSEPHRRVIAFNPEASQITPRIDDPMLSPQNLHGMSCPEMIIVTSGPMAEAAYELAEIHRSHNGMDVEVVDQQQIFNEFSSGTPHVMAIRRFLKMLYNRTPDRLQALLLYGPATVRQAERLDAVSPYVIIPQNEDQGDGTDFTTYSPDYYGNFDLTRNFATDSYFVRLSDEPANREFQSPFFRALITPAVIAVGRIPATSPAEAHAYNRKVAEYLAGSSTASSPAAALFISGFTRRTESMFLYDSEVMASEAAKACSDLMVTRAAHNLYGSSATDSRAIQNLIRTALQRGTSLITYFGHGSNRGLTGVWTSHDVNATRINGTLPSAFFATCHLAQFDKYSKGFWHDMLFKEDGGVIAMVAAGREVYQNYNRQLGKIYANEFYTLPDNSPLGLAFTASLNAIFPTMNKRLICNSLAYNFIGDPMLPRYSSSRQAVITSEAPLKGEIRMADGSVDSNFNGTARIMVMETPFTAVNKAPAISTAPAAGTIREMTLDQDPLMELTVTVEAGQFSIAEALPPGNRDGQTHTLTIYATDGTERATGLGRMEIMPGNDTPDDSLTLQAPEINCLEVTTTGGITTISALITLDGGCTSGSNFGQSVRLIVDGKACDGAELSLQAIKAGHYRFRHSIDTPPDGKHHAELRVSNRLGDTVSASASFTVNRELTCKLNVTETADELQFTISDMPDASPTVTTVIIEDHTGRSAATISSSDSHSASLPLTRLDPGHYRAYARVTTPIGTFHSPVIHLLRVCPII